MKTKKRRQPTEAQKQAANEKRADLCRLSASVKSIVEANNEAVAGAIGTDQAIKWPVKAYAGCLTINEAIKRKHALSTGQREWNTFKGWKEAGFSVQKGEKGFLIWGAPREFKKTVEAQDVKTGEAGEIEQKYKTFPVCYLFHCGQVSNEEEQKPASYNPLGKLASLLQTKPPLALPCYDRRAA